MTKRHLFDNQTQRFDVAVRNHAEKNGMLACSVPVTTGTIEFCKNIWTPLLYVVCIFFATNFLTQKITQKFLDGYSEPSDGTYVPIYICTYIYIYKHILCS